MEAQFISIDYFKKYNGIDMNVSDAICTSVINKAQMKFIQGLLSDSLYYDLMDKIKTNSLNVDEKHLLDKYVQPALAEYALYSYVFSSSYQHKAIGLVQPREENSSINVYKDLRNYRMDVRNDAEEMGERLVKYINNNLTKFPKYNVIDENTVVDTNTKPYFSGMYIPKRNN